MTITLYTQILSGNLGDGWTDNNEAADALADYTERTWRADLAELLAQRSLSFELVVGQWLLRGQCVAGAVAWNRWRLIRHRLRLPCFIRPEDFLLIRQLAGLARFALGLLCLMAAFQP